MPESSKKANFLWPSISDLPSAIRASDQAFWAAVVVAGATASLATLSLTIGKAIASYDASAFIDAALFAIVAWRIKRRSRPWAVVGLVLFLVEKILQVAQDPSVSAGIVMALIIALLFVGGVRGNFAIYKFSQSQASLPAPDA